MSMTMRAVFAALRRPLYGHGYGAETTWGMALAQNRGWCGAAKRIMPDRVGANNQGGRLSGRPRLPVSHLADAFPPPIRRSAHVRPYRGRASASAGIPQLIAVL